MRSSLGNVALAFVVLGAAAVSAAPGDVVTSFPLAVHSFVRDPSANVVYASVTSTNSVAIIDMDTLTLTDSVFVGSAPRGLALSRDGSRLYVATAGATQVAVVDLLARQLLDPYPLPSSPGDVAVGYDGRIYATAAASNHSSLMIVDPARGTTQQAACAACYGSLIEMSPDGRTLYVADRGLSPGRLAKYDVTGPVPTLLWMNAHGALGSNGQDLWLTDDGRHIYYAMGGGNGIAANYDIGQIETATMGVNGSFVTGPYPREIVTSPDGRFAYAVHTSGHIDVWDATTYLKIREYPTVGEGRELFVDRTGGYLLAAMDATLLVMTAEGLGEVTDTDGDGVDDRYDDCPTVANPDQSNVDGDAHGDACDPFPTEPNDHAACLASVADLSGTVAGLEAELETLRPQVEDADDDGVPNALDQCADTVGRAVVDASGCAWDQFCATTMDRRFCRLLDWRNDEPRRPRDCRWDVVAGCQVYPEP